MRAIDAYAAIGDGRTTALVSRDGSIDWLCWPRPDSPSLFGALLDPKAGSWSLRPAGSFRATRRYIERTNVLETRYETPAGVATLIDLMPVCSEEEKRARPVPEHEVLRRLTCEAGEVEFEAVFDPKPDFGRRRVTLASADKFGLRCRIGSATLYLASTAPPNGAWKIRAGEEHAFSLTLAVEGPAYLPPVTEGVRERIDASIEWWRRWVDRCRYDGPAREAVLRSALALKLLGYAPSGALLAAPTTSLPERLGGNLNWDYRFCWLRDASMTARALFGLGFLDEAEAFVSWLLHTTRLTRRNLRILYDVYGKPPPRERTLELEGHRGSKPVRVGNAAKDQLQLDVYGEVLDAVATLVDSGARLDRETASMILAFGDTVCRRWREPDEGLWEPRTGPAHHTHSRLLCWVALDRLLAIESRGQLPKAPVERFRRERELIAREIETRAWSDRLQSYVGVLDTEEIDASVLLMPWYGFKEVGSPRMVGTLARVRTSLGAGDGLLFRNMAAVNAGEGAFGIVSFWAAEYLAMGGGYPDEAKKEFLALVRKANDVGLFAEQIEPATGAPLGNFPQAFTHVGLINAALSLERRMKGLPPMARSVAGREVTRQESEAR